MFARIEAFDKKWSEKLRLDTAGGVLFRIARILAHSGDSWLWCGVLAVLWLFASKDRSRIIAFWCAAIGFTALLVFFLKRLIARSRPSGDWGMIYRKGDPYSFPSGHSVRGALIAVLAVWSFGFPVALAFIIWALLMMLSRIVTGLHYPSDVIGGALIGCLFGGFWIALSPPVFRLIDFFTAFLK